MKALKRAATRLLTEAAALASPTPPEGLRILMYHAVGTKLDFDDLGLSIEPKLFQAEMRRLRDLPLYPLAAASLSSTGVAVTFDDGYRDNLAVAAPILAELNIPFTVFIVPSYIRSGNPYYLDESQLRELARVPGCQIGSHGMNHRTLASLPPDEVEAELRDSRRALEDALSRPVTLLSYPYGSASPAVAEAAARAGYSLAACSRTGVNRPGRDPLMLCRTEILAHDSLRAFSQKLAGAWDWHARRRPDPARW